MTKHKKVQHGIFWNILEYSGTLFLKSQRMNKTFFLNNVKIIKIVHQPYSFLYEQQQQQQQQ